jgi:hypothetical protein
MNGISFRTIFVIAFVICTMAKAVEYEQRYKDCGAQYKNKTAVVIVAYNRPCYLKQCLNAIAANEQLHNFAFVFALDGGTRAAQLENIDVIVKSGIPNQIILKRPHNYGIPKNHIDSKRFVFDWCGFDKAIILEEDMEISPYCLRFLLSALNWAHKNYDNVGVVEVSPLCKFSCQHKRAVLNTFREYYHYWHFRTYILDRSCWTKISKILYGYEQIIDSIPLEYERERSKPMLWQSKHLLKEWVQDVLKKGKPSVINDRTIKTKFSLEKWYKDPDLHLGYCVFNQDNMMGFSLYMNNFIKLSPFVNRAIHIGKIGITTDLDKFENKYKDICLDVFAEDLHFDEFCLAR